MFDRRVQGARRVGTLRTAAVLGAVAVLVSVAPAIAAAPDTGDVASDARPADAEPTLSPLLSGTTSLVQGTHAWTDYAYDDRGPTAGAEPTYPPEAEPGNAADLVQLQLRLDGGDLGIRAVLQTLVDPSVPLLGVGLDLDGDPRTGAPTLPGGAWQVTGTALGLERLVLVDDSDARVLAWTGTDWTEIAQVPASVNPVDNTMDAVVPEAVLGTTGDRWRIVGALGLGLPGHAWTDGDGPIRDLAYVRDTSSSNFQSNTQAAVLTGDQDAADAVATVDVAALRVRRTELAQPEPGIKNTLLYRSDLDLGEGIREGSRKYAGPYQPYAAWFPQDLPAQPSLVVFMHGAGGTHMGGSYGDDGEFAAGVGPGVIAPQAVVVTPLGRQESMPPYVGPGEQDVLDVTDDAIARFDVDPDRVVLTGYSLGGVGTYRLAQLHPDRWAGAVAIVGAHDLGPLTVAEEQVEGTQTLPNQLENLRNLPFRFANSRFDELIAAVGLVHPEMAALELHQRGYDYRYHQLLRREHLTFPVAMVQCELEAAFARGRVRNPARVTYSQEPAIRAHDPEIGLDLGHDAAYWMSEMVVRGESFSPGDKGTVDIVSLARVDREPIAEPILRVGENITGGSDVCGPTAEASTSDAWVTSGQVWTGVREQPTSNGLAATLDGVAAVTVDLPRMGLRVDQPLSVKTASDADSQLRLSAPWRRTVEVSRLGQSPHRVCPVNGVLELAVPPGDTTTTIRPVAGGGRCP